MIPDFSGRVIDIVKLDWGLHFWTDDNWEFMLSEPIVVTTTSAQHVHQVEVVVDVEPAPVPEELVGIEGSTIEQVLVSRQGHLGILLPDRQLTVPPSPRYESWQIAGHGERFICDGGGKLVHFPPIRRGQQTDG